MTRFDVTATCGDAYEGVAQVSMCKEPGEPHLDLVNSVKLDGCMGVSLNGDTPKWMVYRGHPILLRWMV